MRPVIFGPARLRTGINAIVLALFLSASILAQTDRADIVFAEAKSLAASGETVDRSFSKFDEAAALFRNAKDAVKAAEVDLEHGRTLRQVAVREMNAEHWAEAIKYFERARSKFQTLGNARELAYVFHDLGYIADRQGDPKDAEEFHRRALENYRKAGDRNGEAVLLRNLGVFAFNQKRYEEALKHYEAARRLRVTLGDVLDHALLLLDIGEVYEATHKYDDALAKYEAALSQYRAGNDRKGQGKALFKSGVVQSDLYRHADALKSLGEALKVYEAEKVYLSEAETLEQIGRVLRATGKYAEAERFFLRATDTYMILKLPTLEGTSAVDLAINYQSMRRLDDAIASIERGLNSFRAAKHPVGEAITLLVYAEFQSSRDKHDDALAKIRQAEKIFKEFPTPTAEYRIATALAGHYYYLSNYGETIRYLLTAQKLAERDNDLSRQANVFVELANAYSALGQRSRSIEHTKKAYELAKRIGSRYLESICLSNIGYNHLRAGNIAEAERFLNDAIAIMRADGYEREEGYATHNLGLLYYERDEFAKALANYDRAYALYKKTGDRRPEAFVYDSYGQVYRDQGHYDRGVEYFQKAIVLAREVRYSEIEAQALGNMMELWMLRRQPRLAILYGKQAVNVYQTMRAGNRTAEKDAQKSLVESNEKTYRQLANILIEEGRLAEAQQVLDLLKAEEYLEFVRRDAAEADEHATLALNETERKALEQYSRVSEQLTALGASFQTLQDKRSKAGGKLADAEEAEYVRLKTQVEAAGEGLKTFFTKLATEFSKKVEDGTIVTPQSIETLKADLRRAGPDVVLVSTYLLPERYRAIVTTGRTMVDRKVEYSTAKMTGADINRKIFEFQRALQTPSEDPRKLGKELYDIFVRPLENDLRGAGARTILWSLDGSLRYIPIAALSPDGKTYLAERYQNVVVTLGRQSNLFAKPVGDEWRAIGAGVSKQHAGFSALPSVPAEIGSIIREGGSTTGVLEGTRMLDEQFDLEKLRNTVPQQTADGKPFNVLHLATHFSLGANDQDSALLLGDGTRLSLFEIGRDEALDFKDVELLTLSACQTGVSTGDANGREVESLGMLAQKKGAKAVLATLWKVADESTSLFMTEFYRIKKVNPTMNKAEAIRLAQKAMIDGRIKSSGAGGGCRAEVFTTGPKKDNFKCDPNAPYSHPYFWSPFVLIGNWR